MIVYKILVLTVISVFFAGAAIADSSARKDYLADCAECHGVDGQGAQPEKRTLRGYVSVDLTRISERNGGEFPRQKVFDAIDGRHRIAAHFVGDMPRWGARYRMEENGNSGQDIHDRISGLVDLIESMQEK